MSASLRLRFKHAQTLSFFTLTIIVSFYVKSPNFQTNHIVGSIIVWSVSDLTENNPENTSICSINNGLHNILDEDHY